MKSFKKNFSCVLAAALAFVTLSATGCVTTKKQSAVTISTTVVADGPETMKYGNLDFNIPTNDFLALFEHGDVAVVEIEKYGKWEVPVCPNYDDVPPGEKLLRIKPNKEYAILAKNYGQFAVDMGLAEKAPAGSKFAYKFKDDVKFPVNAKITLKKKGAYIENLKLGKLNRTTDRTQYPKLTDAEFGNFREIKTKGIAPKTLYRASSPINPEIGRNLYADKAASEAGVKTFINLADSEETAKSYPDFADSYYGKQNVIYLNLPVALAGDTFAEGIGKGLKFIANNEGPYLVHCTEGKDRAGFTAALLEALMGASFKDIQEEYFTTYYNYYDVVDGKQAELTPAMQDAIRNIIVRNMELVFGQKKLEKANLSKIAENYLTTRCGMTAQDVAAVKAKLAGK